MKFLAKIFWFILPFSVFSQGFDWQPNPRLPFSIPKYYFGLFTTGSIVKFDGNWKLLESGILCSKFTSGSGKTIGFGVSAEYWYLPEIAFNVNFSFSSNRGNLVTLGDSFPVLIKNIPTTVKVQNEMDLQYSSISFSLGAKYRLFNTNFFVASSMEFAVKTANNYEIYEQVVSPPEYHFADLTQRRKLSDGYLSDLNLFVVAPKICFGYDAIVLWKVYASVYIAYEIPIFNYSKDDNLKVQRFTLNFSLLKGIY